MRDIRLHGTTTVLLNIINLNVLFLIIIIIIINFFFFLGGGGGGE